MKKIIAISIIAMSLNTSAQISAITSFGFGYESDNSAIPVQLVAGISSKNKRSELVLGYTVFFHKADATIPKILFLRYGLALPAGSIEIMPLIGAGVLLPTTYEKSIPADEQHVYDDYINVRTPAQFKILYGLKVQKAMGLGGLFVSVEHCKLNYANVGLFVRID